MTQKTSGPITQFIDHHYRHFNAAALKDGAQGYNTHLTAGGKMMVSLAGAMSTAELGLSLAEMIRQDKVHIISCTGANLEEDILNLIAHNLYKRVPNYRDLSPEDEVKLLNDGFARVTDTCIPEWAFENLWKHCFTVLKEKEAKNERIFPHEMMYEVLRREFLKSEYKIDPKNSWMLAACEKNIPIVVPGWEDSTMGNIFAAHVYTKELKSAQTIKSGIEYMTFLYDWYQEHTRRNSVGFFQIGGGIAGDFPICVVPSLHIDLERKVPLWGYFCQISDSTTSYGSYSGATPNEKITWCKLGVESPKYIIESDASIVAPLMFSYILGW
jgi:deoxyhypusine synthase